MTRNHTFLSSTVALACVLGALSIAGCNKNGAPAQSSAGNTTADNTASADTGNTVAEAGAPAGAIPPTDAAPPAPLPTAPAGAALPPAPPAPVAPPPQAQEQYSYVSQAASMGAAFADSPPDYAVDYQDSRPWIWRAGNGAYRVAEAVPGGMRYYYYAAGQTTPFFIQDPQYAYAFTGGGLTIVYDAHGHPLPPGTAASQAAMAGRYLARAKALYQAAAHEQHQAVYLANWRAKQSLVLAQQQQWQAQQQKDAAWRAWNQAHADQQQATWSREQALRRRALPRAREPRRRPIAPARRRRRLGNNERRWRKNSDRRRRKRANTKPPRRSRRTSTKRPSPPSANGTRKWSGRAGSDPARSPAPRLHPRLEHHKRPDPVVDRRVSPEVASPDGRHRPGFEHALSFYH
jgi:hypothetical protein